MTYQGGPNRNQRRPGDYIRRDDGSWSMMPILLGLVVVLGLGYLLLGEWNRSTTSVTGDTTTRQTTAPKTTMPTPSPPKQ